MSAKAAFSFERDFWKVPIRILQFPQGSYGTWTGISAPEFRSVKEGFPFPSSVLPQKLAPEINGKKGSGSPPSEATLLYLTSAHSGTLIFLFIK